MQWVPSCCLPLLLLILQIKMIYTSDIVQNDDPHKTEPPHSRRSRNRVPLRTRWSDRHWEVEGKITAELRGLHVWTLHRKKGSLVSCLTNRISCPERDLLSLHIFTFIVRNNKKMDPPNPISTCVLVKSVVH